MRLVVSRHVSLLPIAQGRFLCGHAFLGPRTVVDAEQRALIEAFATPRDPDAYLRELAGDARATAAARIAMLRRKQILVDAEVDEDAALAAGFGPHLDATRDVLVRQQMRSPLDPRTRFPLASEPVVASPHDAWSVVYLGRCLVLPSMDALVARAAAVGIAVDAAGSFPNDLALVDEKRPDFVVLGDLHRVGLARGDARPVQYAREMRMLVEAVRARTPAPILIHNLPVPTVDPEGIAAGTTGLVQRVRAIDVELAALTALPDVYLVDIDAALALAGKHGLVDDMVVSSHHLGSLTWLVERARREPIASAHAIPQLLAELAPAPLATEHVIADETLRVMRAIRGTERRKLVVVDLDDTLWPGVLAETGAPFPPALAVDVYPHHLYLGLHEALLALRDRGILLACVSKNDEAVVRELWTYPPAFGARALVLDDFVTHRINWRDKVDNIVEIADELGVALDAIAVVDDHPVERARITARLPDALVLGDNPFATRWRLLTDPAFQVPRPTDEARRRTEMVRGQLARERTRTAATSEREFLATLEMACQVQRAGAGELPRIEELVARTTQLNTTGETRTRAELAQLAIYTLHARDRFVDYGLVGACLVDGAEIVQLVVSCRVIGLELDQVLVRAVAAELCARGGTVTGRFVATPRNAPARHVFARAGFQSSDGQRWTADASALASAPPLPPYAIAVG